MGVGILAPSEEIAADFTTKLTNLMSKTAEELSTHPQFAGKIQIVPPREDSE